MQSSSSRSAELPLDGELLRRFLEASRRARIAALVNAARTEEELAELAVVELCEAYDAEIAIGAITAARLVRVVATWAAVFALFALAFIVDYAVLPGIDHRYRAVLYPGDRLADELARRFRAATGAPLAYVIGGMWDGGNVAHYAREQPRVLIDGDPRRAPWIDLGDLSSKGAVVVWTGGDPRIKPWPEQTPDDWRYTYEVNVIAAERLIHLLTPKMVARGWGRVINVSSIYGSLGQDPRNTGERGGAGAYTAAKHGMIGLTHYVACQLGRTGVTVNTLSPGMITWNPDPTDEARRKWAELADKTPVGRTSQPEDYVAATVFLASEGASFVHGHNLVVDGGWSIW